MCLRVDQGTWGHDQCVVLLKAGCKVLGAWRDGDLADDAFLLPPKVSRVVCCWDKGSAKEKGWCPCDEGKDGGNEVSTIADRVA